MARGLGLLKKLRSKAGLIGIGTFAAGLHGFISGQPGHRKDTGREAAILGALATAALVSAPSFTKIIFRRIRGRIIPIRKR